MPARRKPLDSQDDPNINKNRSRRFTELPNKDNEPIDKRKRRNSNYEKPNAVEPVKRKSDTQKIQTSNQEPKVRKRRSSNFRKTQIEEVDEKKEAETLYNCLKETFVDADSLYLKSIINNNLSLNLDHIVEDMLKHGYPKSQENKEQEFLFLKEIFPDAIPEFLVNLQQKQELNYKSFIEQFNEAVEQRNYPKIEDLNRKRKNTIQVKQYTSHFSVINFLQMFPDPQATFENSEKHCFMGELSINYARVYFRNRFNEYYLKDVESVFSKCKYQIVPTFNAINDLIEKEKIPRTKTKRKVIDLPEADEVQIEILQQLAYIEHKEIILKHFTKVRKEIEEKRERCKAIGLIFTCQCCFDDQFMEEEIATCEKGCKFCKTCIKRGVEVAMGEAKYSFDCLGNCKGSFSLQTLKTVLDSNTFSVVARKKASAEVAAAGIADVEFCPFCDFATIPPIEDKVFKCLNPECMKESCRLCKQISHTPLACNEIEEDSEVKQRVFIENQMSEALLRTCWNCGKKFCKEEGCNKMTCICGAHTCYICGEKVTDYSHFNGIGGTNFNLCPLYTNDVELNKKKVLEAAEKAKKEMKVRKLKYDPTIDVENHFNEKAKNLKPETREILDIIRRQRRGVFCEECGGYH